MDASDEERMEMPRDRLLETAIEGAGILLFLIDENGMVQLSTGRQDFLFPSRLGENPIWSSIYYAFAGYPDIILDIEQTLKGDSRRREVIISNRLLEARYIPLLNHANAIEGVVLTFTDITRHRQVEAALKEQESFVKLLQEVTAASNEADDVAGVLQYAVDRVCSFTGWPVGHAVLARSVEALFPRCSIWRVPNEEDLLEFRRQRDALQWLPEIGLPGQAMETGQPKWYVSAFDETSEHHQERDNRLKASFAFPILAGREAVGVLEFYTDKLIEPTPAMVEVMIHIGTQLGRVIERKRAEYLLRDSEEMFRSTFEDAGVGVVLQTLEGEVIECNPAFQAMLGCDAVNLRGKNYRDFTHPEDLDEYQAHYGELTGGRRERIQMEKRYLSSDGRTVWANITGSLLRDATGKPKQVILLADDVTESRQLQSDLEEVRSHLMKYREQERLNIARDLHDGPLQEWYGIIYTIQELVEISGSADLSHRLEELRTVVEQQIVDLRAISNELRPPVLVPFGLAKAIDSHINQFKEKHPGLSLHVELEEDGKLLPEEMRLNLYRIYQELLNNIIRHARASQVHIRFYMREREVELQVEDDGAGFEMPQRWVERARQGHLGLLGARERAEAVGGRIEIQSTPGQGTLARVFVPLPAHITGGNAQDIGFAARRTLRS